MIGTTIFIYVLWIADFIYEGGVPLIKILFHLPYNYRLFGIPSLHVFIVTFSSFFTVYLFHLYLSKRTRLLLILYLVNLSAALLIYSRAMLFFNITGSVIVYFISMRKNSVATNCTGYRGDVGDAFSLWLVRVATCIARSE
ncbi:MAG: hypothetical protein WDO15_03565 [Bacteroidota bacterium]